MAYLAGTATNAEDLLQQFRTFITTHADLVNPPGAGPSQAWQELKYVAGTPGGGSGATPYELYLKGPGFAAQDNIHVNIQLRHALETGADSWLWRVDGATGFLAGATFGNQPGNNDTLFNGNTGDRYINMPLYTGVMPYWFFANGRRFIIVARVTASVYVHCYCGFIVPYTPSVAALEYRYPLYIGANQGVPVRFSNTSGVSMRSFWDPGYVSDVQGTGWLYTPGNQWIGCRNINSSGVDEISGATSVSSPSRAVIAGRVRGTYGASRTTSGYTPNFDPSTQLPLLDGSYLLSPFELITPTDIKNTNGFIATQAYYGALDGCHYLSGVGQSSENTLTVGADTYFVVQQAHRTGTNFYAAIKVN